MNWFTIVAIFTLGDASLCESLVEVSMKQVGNDLSIVDEGKVQSGKIKIHLAPAGVKVDGGKFLMPKSEALEKLLRTKVGVIKEAELEPVSMISVDEAVKHQDVVDVLKLCVELEIEKVTFVDN